MRQFYQGQTVHIKDAKHSGPTTEMYNMVGSIQIIESVYSDDNYNIRGYIWSGMDLDLPIDPPEPVDKSPKTFDIKNLVI
jgi:hypothetical protein